MTKKEFIDDIAKPALDEVRDDLRSRGIEANVISDDDSATIFAGGTPGGAGSDTFQYKIEGTAKAANVYINDQTGRGVSTEQLPIAPRNSTTVIKQETVRDHCSDKFSEAEEHGMKPYKLN